jgi:two-component system OmpR family sensor kinase
MKINTLRFKLTVWYLIILGAIVAASGVFLFQVLKEKRLVEFDRDLKDRAEELANRWERTRGLSWEQAIALTQEGSRRPFIRVVRYFDHEPPKGAPPETNIRSANVPENAFRLDGETYRRAMRFGNDPPMILTMEEPLLNPGPLRVILLPVSRNEFLQFGVTLNEWSDDLRGLGLLMLAAGGLILGLAFAGGSLMIRKALGPVQGVVRAARKITADDLSLRLPIRRQKDEIGELVDTFNGMIARLDESVGKIRQFSGDVSHELRTPLTIIRGEIEVLLRKDHPLEEYRQTVQSILEETGRLEKIIGDLLFLSRLETVDGSAFEDDVRLEDVAQAVVERWAPIARRKGVILAINIAESVPVRGHRDILERLIANLADNAVRYTPAGGRVDITVDRDERAGRLIVVDTGIGIPQESIPMIFDRFSVVDASRSKDTGGVGLGLSIAKRVADIHGASIEVSSRVGEGTRFIVRFPPA